MGKTEFIITIIVFNLFFILFIAAIVIYIRQYRAKKNEHSRMLEHQFIEHQRELLSTQLEIQLLTMQHIGREIHDNIGQKLTLASLYAQRLAYENKAPQINENIATIGKIIDDSLAELRQLSKSLTDNAIESDSLSNLLEAECRKVKELGRCKVSFYTNAQNLQPDYQIKSVLIRVAQEFLQNSMKHSDCENIVLRLAHSGGNLQLRITDDGCGFDTRTIKSSGIGLANMRKRIQIIGGTFDLESDAEGTRLTLQIPMK